MSCSCGLNHQDTVIRGEGEAVSLAQPMIGLTGRLICDSTDDMLNLLSFLPDHLRTSRDEPGCLRFDIHQSEDPKIWHANQLFLNRDAVEAHKARAASSDWARITKGQATDFDLREVTPFLRPERPGDASAIENLLNSAFDGTAESEIVARLRREGDLAVSLVIEAEGELLGHIALSPTGGDVAGLALAPLSVLPKAQRLGLGSKLVNAALAAAGTTPVIVVGDPAYYGRFGFAPADLQSPYAGPYLQQHGQIPQGSKVNHCDAFMQS